MTMTNEQLVEGLYIGYFGRAGEPDGANYWQYQLDTGQNTPAQAAASFSVQHEATQEYAFLAGTSSDASAFVDQVYQNLFNRLPDAEGKAYWMDQLAHAGPSDVGDFILDVISGAQGNDLAAINNKIEAATHFTNTIQSSGIETTHFVDGHFELTPEANAAAHDVVDSEVTADNGSIATSDAEIASFVDAHTTTVPGPGGGGTVYVPTEPAHDLSFTLNGTLPTSSTENYDGTEMGYGSGNMPTNFAFLVDDTAGDLIGFKAHFRTGDDVAGTAGSGDVDVVWNMPAGAQDGTIGNENGANADRAHASLDIVIDNGVGSPNPGEYVLKIDNDPTASTNFQNFTLTDLGGGNWAFLDDTGTVGQGMTVSNEGHVLADSFNFGFDFAAMPHGATNGDVLPGTYDVELVKLVGGVEVADLHGQFELA